MRVHFKNVDKFSPPPLLFDLEEKVMNVAKIFFENFLKVIPVSGIQFPSDTARTCKLLFMQAMGFQSQQTTLQETRIVKWSKQTLGFFMETQLLNTTIIYCQE